MNRRIFEHGQLQQAQQESLCFAILFVHGSHCTTDVSHTNRYNLTIIVDDFYRGR
jgi:hypothetical protein